MSKECKVNKQEQFVFDLLGKKLTQFDDATEQTVLTLVNKYGYDEADAREKVAAAFKKWSDAYYPDWRIVALR
jgi:hypothetical protein